MLRNSKDRFVAAASLTHSSSDHKPLASPSQLGRNAGWKQNISSAMKHPILSWRQI